MRILLVIDEPPDASMGGPKVAVKLQAAFRADGHECDLWLRPQLGSRPGNHRLRQALAPWLVRRRLRVAGGANYDIVDASGAESWLAAGVLAQSDGRRQTAVIARSHGLEHRFYQELLADAAAGIIRKPWSRRMWFPAVRLPQVRAALRRADGVIVPSRQDGDFVTRHGWQPPEHVGVVPHGVEELRWQQAPALNAPRGAGVLFCGWWTSSKGVTYLSQAFHHLAERGVTMPLTLLGIGRAEPAAHWQKWENKVRRAFPDAMQAGLRVLPRTENEDAVFAEYRRHDLLLAPSTSEGFGLAVLEAVSQRLPVICSQSAGVAELLPEAAGLVPARDSQALAQTLERLWRNPQERQAMAGRAYSRLRELTWQQAARHTVAVYEAALERVGVAVTAAHALAASY